jgi:outer membrane protein assembly factor BamB
MTVEGGTLFVGTGFGEVLALDPASGGVRWRTTVAAPVQAAPTLGNGRLLVVSRDDMAYGLDPATGAIDWQVQGIGGPGLLGGASPAANGKLAILPFSSGEVQGVLARNGLEVWSTSVTGGRRAFARNSITDISGAPVLDGAGTVYASNQSGRTVRLDTDTGERAWTIQEGSYGPAWPVGGSLFLLSDIGSLVRADAATGELLWQVQLPELFPNPGWFGRGKPYMAVAYYGPVLAGGRLWVAGADGLLRGFSPADGTQVASVALPGGAAGQPAVAGGVMYVPTRDGKLLAFQ